MYYQRSKGHGAHSGNTGMAKCNRSLDATVVFTVNTTIISLEMFYVHKAEFDRKLIARSTNCSITGYKLLL